MLIFGLALMAGGLGVLVLFRGELGQLGFRPRRRWSWRARRVLQVWVYRLLGGSPTPARRTSRPAERAGLPGDQPTRVSVPHRRSWPRAVGRATPPPSAIVRPAGHRPSLAPRPRRTH